jgi:hypothetical protein
VKKAKQEGQKTNYIMGRMLYKMLMRPATSLVEVRACLLAYICLQILSNSCLRLQIECCTSYTQFAGYKKRLEEMNRLVQNLGPFRNNFKIEDARNALEQTIATTTGKYQDAIAELEVLFTKSEDFEDFEDVEGSIELERANPVVSDVLAEL